MYRWVQRLLVAALLASCAPAATQPIASARPLRFAGPAKSLVLPVTELPTGTRISTEGPLTASDLAATGSDPATFEAVLGRQLFIASYWRTFVMQRSGRLTEVECIVLLFSEKEGAQAVVAARGDSMSAYGYRPISVRQTFGDSSQALSFDGVGKDPSGRESTVTSVRVLFALSNVAVFVSIQDDPKNVDPLDAIDLANRELKYLRVAAPLASPK